MIGRSILLDCVMHQSKIVADFPIQWAQVICLNTKSNGKIGWVFGSLFLFSFFFVTLLRHFIFCILFLIFFSFYFIGSFRRAADDTLSCFCLSRSANRQETMPLVMRAADYDSQLVFSAFGCRCELLTALKRRPAE